MKVQSFDQVISGPSGSNAKDPLEQLKGRICRLLDDYIGSIDLGCTAIPYKFSIFGHHHDDRARAVKQAIQSTDSADEVRKILNSQKVAFAKENVLDQPHSLDSRWFNDTPGNLPQFNLLQSGYYSQIEAAFNEYEAVYPPKDDFNIGDEFSSEVQL